MEAPSTGPLDPPVSVEYVALLSGKMGFPMLSPPLDGPASVSGVGSIFFGVVPSVTIPDVTARQSYTIKSLPNERKKNRLFHIAMFAGNI